MDLGVHALAAGRAADALERLDVALAADPSSTRAIFYRGLALEQLGHRESALEIMASLALGEGKYEGQAREFLRGRATSLPDDDGVGSVDVEAESRGSP
jgi:Tfp pilus assembly protein PilF